MRVKVTAGYIYTAESFEGSGVYEENEVTRSYAADTIKKRSSWPSADKQNDDISFNNELSIIADGYAFNNFQFLKYVIFKGTKWEVSSVELDYPRLIVSFGGVYNGEQA